MSLFWVFVIPLILVVSITILKCDVSWKREEYEKELGSWFRHIAFELFGETNLFIWLAALWIYCVIVGVLSVAHFLIKYW